VPWKKAPETVIEEEGETDVKAAERVAAGLDVSDREFGIKNRH
jgi:hypothetical protein